MSKISSRKKNIIISAVLFFGVLTSLFVYNWVDYSARLQFPECNDPQGCIRIYGNVQQEAFIGISNLQNGSVFEYEEEKEYDMLNSWGTEYHRSFAGVKLADILKKTQVLMFDAEKIRFEAVDGFKSFDLPISIILDNPDSILLVNFANGQKLKTKEQGGDGPIMGFVKIDAILNNTEVLEIFQDNDQNTVYNSVYNVKYLSAIYVY